jgi:hypothetical protein
MSKLYTVVASDPGRAGPGPGPWPTVEPPCVPPRRRALGRARAEDHLSNRAGSTRAGADTLADGPAAPAAPPARQPGSLSDES